MFSPVHDGEEDIINLNFENSIYQINDDLILPNELENDKTLQNYCLHKDRPNANKNHPKIVDPHMINSKLECKLKLKSIKRPGVDPLPIKSIRTKSVEHFNGYSLDVVPSQPLLHNSNTKFVYKEYEDTPPSLKRTKIENTEENSDDV